MKVEKTGSRVNSNLAELIDQLFQEGMGDDLLKNLKKEVLRLENCDSLRKVSESHGLVKFLGEC